jgi:membrane protein CcdC involved in cytochrome C biogenesis
MQLMLAASAVGMSAVIAWRVRETRRALTVSRIVMPPLGMSMGFSMFLVDQFRMPLIWAITAFVAGFFVFSYPLIRTSVLTRNGGDVMMRGSPAFLIVILLLALIRFVLRGYVETIITPMQTAALFFVLAFGMIVRWRLHMLRTYQALTGHTPK